MVGYLPNASNLQTWLEASRHRLKWFLLWIVVFNAGLAVLGILIGEVFTVLAKSVGTSADLVVVAALAAYVARLLSVRAYLTFVQAHLLLSASQVVMVSLLIWLEWQQEYAVRVAVALSITLLGLTLIAFHLRRMLPDARVRRAAITGAVCFAALTVLWDIVVLAELELSDLFTRVVGILSVIGFSAAVVTVLFVRMTRGPKVRAATSEPVTPAAGVTLFIKAVPARSPARKGAPRKAAPRRTRKSG